MKCICGKSVRRTLLGKGCSGTYCSGHCRKRAQRERAARVTKKPDIQFYCGLNEKAWNYHSMDTGTHVCIAPVTGRNEDDGSGKQKKGKRETSIFIDETKITHVLLDSGAFSDGIELENGRVIRSHRLSFDHALQRQIAHAYKYHYAHLVEALVSYDLLIDEVWQDGERSKIRWSVDAARYAVQESIAAAHYLASQRHRIDNVFGHHVHLVLSAQGVDAEQYLRCAEALVQCMQPDDLFGLGGWCITGRLRHTMLPAAASILPGVFEVLGRASIKRVHVFGVILPQLLGFLLYLCGLYNMQLSTDSSGPCREPAEHGNWGYGSWTDPTYRQPPVLSSCKAIDEYGRKAPICPPGTFCRGLERSRHVQLTRAYLAHFRERESSLCVPLPVPIRQLTLLEIAL